MTFSAVMAVTEKQEIFPIRVVLTASACKIKADGH